MNQTKLRVDPVFIFTTWVF